MDHLLKIYLRGLEEIFVEKFFSMMIQRLKPPAAPVLSLAEVNGISV
jgi:hypothetical protein